MTFINYRVTIVVLLFYCNSAICQVRATSQNYWMAKEFSKEIALFNAKRYLFKEVLGPSPNITKFEIVPLAAASSGELTTLLYKCDEKQKEGLVLGFYGNYWNDAGILYQGFAFKNLDKNEAFDFLNKIQSAIEANLKFMKENPDNSNIYFTDNDIDILISATEYGIYNIRLFWKGFDSTWEKTAFERSKKRFEKKIH